MQGFAAEWFFAHWAKSSEKPQTRHSSGKICVLDIKMVDQLVLERVRRKKMNSTLRGAVTRFAISRP
jgi:hypothetical protein